MSEPTGKSLVDKLQEYSVPLIVGVLAALVWANVDLPSYEAVVYGSPFGHGGALGHYATLHFLVNDVFMALFFGIATKEIVESCLPGGALNPVRKAVNPLLGTLGGVLGPVCVYHVYVALSGDATIHNGWGIPTATDIALAWLVARVAFGGGHPAVSFLLLLAIADDAIGLGIIAVFYPDPVHPVRLELLGVVAFAAALAWAMRKRGVHDYRAYLLGPGVLSWVGLHFAHLHPALALVPVIPFLPHEARDVGLFVEQQDGVFRADALNRFASAFKLPVAFGLFFFGLANAGVPFSNVGHATWAVFLSLLVGKTCGVFLFSLAARRVGFELPTGMNVRSLFAAGVTAGLGLTVALFVAGVAFTDAHLQGAAKMGALMSAFIAPLAIFVARALGAHRIEGKDPVEEHAAVVSAAQ
jgi:NhaA family Na+:H+ antiporter